MKTHSENALLLDGVVYNLKRGLDILATFQENPADISPKLYADVLETLRRQIHPLEVLRDELDHD